MVSIEWTKEADSDINEILFYLSKSSLQYASSLLENIDESINHLKKFPLVGRRVPESDNENDREILLTPYRLLYRYFASEHKIFIMMIIHGSRHLKPS